MESSFVFFRLNKQVTDLTLEQTLVVLLFEGQQLSGSLADLGQSVLDAPHFALVTQTIFADGLQLLVQTGLLVRPTGSYIGLREDRRNAAINHFDCLLC